MQNKTQLQFGKWHHLFQAFPFSAKVGFDSELKNSNFLQEIALFNIWKYFQFTPRIENPFAIPGFSIWKATVQVFRWMFRINSINEAFLKIPGALDLQNDSK